MPARFRIKKGVGRPLLSDGLYLQTRDGRIIAEATPLSGTLTLTEKPRTRKTRQWQKLWHRHQFKVSYQPTFGEISLAYTGGVHLQYQKLEAWEARQLVEILTCLYLQCPIGPHHHHAHTLRIHPRPGSPAHRHTLRIHRRQYARWPTWT